MDHAVQVGRLVAPVDPLATGAPVTSLAQVRAGVRDLFARWGLSAPDPVVLSDRGNLVLWCQPHAVVARVATRFPGDDPSALVSVWRRELAVAEHLRRLGIPIVEPATNFPAGPHPMAGTWMSLWNHAPSGRSTPPALDLTLVRRLTDAMAQFPGDLPDRGAWIHPQDALPRLNPLRSHDADVARLATEVERLDDEMGPRALWPAHGDAHAGNLLWTGGTWRWIDFEEASRMPRFWDLATFVAQGALAQPTTDPLVLEALALPEVAADPEAFRWAVRARVTGSVATALGLAAVGQGDREVARGRLGQFAAFREQWG